MGRRANWLQLVKFCLVGGSGYVVNLAVFTIAISALVSGAIVTPNVTAVAFGDLISVDVDQIGSTVAGSDLTVVVLVAAN